MADLKNKNSEELMKDYKNHKGNIIPLPEAIIFLLLNASADLFEWIGIFSIFLFIPAFIYGVFISLGTIFWGFFRTKGGNFVVKQALKRIVVPQLAVSFFPIRSVVLLLSIWFNNHIESGQLEKVAGILKKLKYL